MQLQTRVTLGASFLSARNEVRFARMASGRKGPKSCRGRLCARPSDVHGDPQQLMQEAVTSKTAILTPRTCPDDRTVLHKQGQSGVDSEEESGRSNFWDRVGGKNKLLVASSMAFVLCNMDKVNMSIAIIPMAHEYGWSPSVSGLVQSSFFYGYMLCQIPGGLLSTALGGSRMLPVGVGLWSAATMAVPFMRSSVLGLCFSRALVGLGEALSPAAATDMIARAALPEERARATSIVFGGLNLGTIVGLLVSPIFVQVFGWESVFYAFGGLGIMWVVFFQNTLMEVSKSDPDLISSLTSKSVLGTEKENSEALPWRAILRCQPLRALMFTHFCNNWFHYTMLAWLPTYFVETLSLDLSGASHLALIPPIAAILVSLIAGPFADSLISKGWQVSHVRKLAQSIAFLGPMLCLGGASISSDGLVDLVCITAALGLGTFSTAGLYCNHQDLSRKYASVLLGVTNTVGALPGIAGIAVAGYLLDTTGSWSLSLFLPSMVLFAAGTVVFNLYGSGEPQDFSNNQPLEIEVRLTHLRKMGTVLMNKCWSGDLITEIRLRLGIDSR